jgi:hypothetical protein
MQSRKNTHVLMFNIVTIKEVPITCVLHCRARLAQSLACLMHTSVRFLDSQPSNISSPWQRV